MPTQTLKRPSRSVQLAIFILISIISVRAVSAQTMSCSEVYNTVIQNYDYKDSASCFGSSMLAKVEYYRLDNMGFVVGYLKKSDYDFSGQPYIFCGISSYQWSSFKSSGMTGSWGEAFHEYIMDYTCDCY